MKSKAIRELENLDLIERQTRYQDVPYITRRSFTDRSANDLTKCIIRFLTLKGHQAERINTTGRPVDRRKTYTDVLGHRRQIGNIEWIRGTGTRGSADISATINGRSVKIEVKFGRDRQRPEQRQYQEAIERAGGLYVIATSFDQFYQWYKTMFN
jgi:preprotein translocase subunit SecA